MMKPFEAEAMGVRLPATSGTPRSLLAFWRIMNHVKTSRVGGPPPPRVQLPPGTLPVRAIVLCLGGR